MTSQVVEKMVPIEAVEADVAEEKTEEKAPDAEKGREEAGA